MVDAFGGGALSFMASSTKEQYGKRHFLKARVEKKVNKNPWL